MLGIFLTGVPCISPAGVVVRNAAKLDTFHVLRVLQAQPPDAIFPIFFNFRLPFLPWRDCLFFEFDSSIIPRSFSVRAPNSS